MPVKVKGELSVKNYISINNQKIELTAEQVEAIKKSLSISDIKLSDVAVGETFKIGEYEFIVLEHSRETTAAILKDLLFENKVFGKSNNFSGSYVDNLCKDFADEISGVVGANNLVEHTVDLTSDDGLKDYGKVKRRVSLLTANLYRRYVEILDKYKVNKWWWLATAWSTPKHNDAVLVKCVAPAGIIFNFICNYNYGVRPFCIFNSSIFVSK